ncbi:MAG: hypothetical protein JW936_00045 [Sedimentisphaerales bacterium]|nr:hypothetical protein [Sedimentisphaerales bacterium]
MTNTAHKKTNYTKDMNASVWSTTSARAARVLAWLAIAILAFEAGIFVFAVLNSRWQQVAVTSNYAIYVAYVLFCISCGLVIAKRIYGLHLMRVTALGALALCLPGLAHVVAFFIEKTTNIDFSGIVSSNSFYIYIAVYLAYVALFILSIAFASKALSEPSTNADFLPSLRLKAHHLLGAACFFVLVAIALRSLSCWFGICHISQVAPWAFYATGVAAVLALLGQSRAIKYFLLTCPLVMSIVILVQGPVAVSIGDIVQSNNPGGFSIPLIEIFGSTFLPTEIIRFLFTLVIWLPILIISAYVLSTKKYPLSRRIAATALPILLIILACSSDVLRKFSFASQLQPPQYLTEQQISNLPDYMRTPIGVSNAYSMVCHDGTLLSSYSVDDPYPAEATIRFICQRFFDNGFQPVPNASAGIDEHVAHLIDSWQSYLDQDRHEWWDLRLEWNNAEGRCVSVTLTYGRGSTLEEYSDTPTNLGVMIQTSELPLE